MAGGTADDTGERALQTLRDIWQATGQSGADLAEETGRTRSCKNMRQVGFGGLAGTPENAGEQETPVSSGLRAAWRSQLAREGKLNPGSRGPHEPVDGPPRQEQRER